MAIDLASRFSALKMDGKPLYEYARNGIPLPRKIEKRMVTVHSLEIVEWKGSDHTYRFPEKKLTEDERRALEKTLRSIEESSTVSDDPDATQDTNLVPTAFVLRMSVSGGTYVRSIVHDLGHAVGSAAHVVTLTRSRQGRFVLEPQKEGDIACVPWQVFQSATESVGDVDEEGHVNWERQVLDKFEIVENKIAGQSASMPKASARPVLA
jgi:tRNA pseudouridine55 synthase